MDATIDLNVRWDAEAAVLIATSIDLPGLVLEAGSWPELLAEAALTIPDLIDFRANTDAR